MEEELKLIITTSVPIILALLAGLGWLYKNEREKRQQIEQQLSEKKYLVYEKFITVYFDLLKNIKKGRNNDSSKLTDTMLDIKKELTIFGGDEVLKKFFIWQEKSASNNPSLRYITDILIEMRKDMGFPKTKISTDQFLRSMVNSHEDYRVLKDQGIL